MNGIGYNMFFGFLHWILFIALIFIAFIPIEDINNALKAKRALIWKIKVVCMPILIGVNGLVLLGFYEDIITGLGGLAFECIAMICLGIFFAYIFFIHDKDK